MPLIFELPQEALEQARPAASGAVELTAQALQALELQEGGGGAAAAADTPGGSGEAGTRAGGQGASTCIACGIGVSGTPGFASPEEQRLHMCTDWHRYNVKRRVAGLAPVSEEAFAALIDRRVCVPAQCTYHPLASPIVEPGSGLHRPAALLLGCKGSSRPGTGSPLGPEAAACCPLAPCRNDQAEVGSLSGSESGDSEASDSETAPSTSGRGAGPQFQFLLPGMVWAP